MRSRLLNLGLLTLILSIGCMASAQAQEQAIVPATTSPAGFSLVTGREPVVSLNGLWRFHPGDDPLWASPNFDDSTWPLIRSDHPWSEQGYPNLGGFAWYRFTIQTPSPSPSLDLLLPSILTDYELFEDGKNIGGVGQMPPHGSLRFNQTLLYRLNPTPPGTTIHLAIRVWHHPTLASYLGGGPRYGGGMAGDAAILEHQFQLEQAARSTLVASFFAVGILNAVIGITVFGLYLARRSEREYLWFALVLLAAALQAALTISNFFLDFPVGPSDFTAELFGALSVSASLFFFSRVLDAKRTLVWYAVLLVALLDPLNVPLFVLRLVPVALSTSLRISFDLPIEFYILILLSRRALDGNRNARLLIGPTFLLYGTGILGGLLLLAFQLGLWSQTLSSINQWNVFETPFPVQLQAFVQFLFIVALLTFLIRRFASSRAQEERYSADLEAARTIQQVLIPETLPDLPGLEITAAYHPAQEVGGDFYQILQLPAEPRNTQPDTLIVLGDVAGKGLPAAMTVSMLVGALRSIIEVTSSPAEILAGLNRRLLGRSSGFTTCIVIRISFSGQLTLANAGHLSPYRNGQELATAPALPLGLDPNATFPELTFQCVPGDRLTLITDGVPEATRHSELFGFARTASLSTKPASEIAQSAIHFGQTDDITVLSIVSPISPKS
jgi:sigma-B regulation protein RsbU (phosphoserine phosphatase)